ncbi:MAG: hypothetical protein JST93_35875 [Acidobacteria bacterium]|nr:hypothetical protein [Acidobacteriota bacterium]
MKRILLASILTLALTGGTVAVAHGNGHHHGQGNGQCQNKGKCNGSGKQQARGQKKGTGECKGNCGNGPRDGTGYGARQQQEKTK